jgi:patatin-like phospholipase/acyl hydrolase
MRILTLDGGGSKGVYTIGVLRELEAVVDVRLSDFFNLIYGTSTGSIIAALIALDYTMEDIEKIYFDLVPKIMAGRRRKIRTNLLKAELERMLGDRRFDAFKTDVSIVATNYDSEQPLIFKSNKNQAYSRKGTFEPGFGCTISEAVLASSAAYPIFNRAKVTTANQSTISALDGGFIANNPTLLAITDALKSLNKRKEEVSILSVGTGNFYERPMNFLTKTLSYFELAKLFEKILKSNSNTTDTLIKLLFSDMNIVRINDTFNQPQYGTNMIEKNVDKLKLLYRCGRESFGPHEEKVKALFKLS